MTPQQQEILKEYQRRRTIQSSMVAWTRHAGFEPAEHHRLLINEIERASRTRDSRLIFCLPPGSAKSTYISKLFPPWFLAQGSGKTILACSYSKDLIVGFGRAARNFIELHGNVLGFSLKQDTKAADEWETTNSGRYFCAGVNAGIAGHRADLAFIDDPIGSNEDARSQNYRDKQWQWFWDDFIPRLRPGGTVIIIANRRHEDDLVGRLLATEPESWRLIKVPLVIDTQTQADADPLHRRLGARLWPEWFTEKTVIDARKSDNFSGLHQQDPSPEEGDLIKRDWLVEYDSPTQLPKELRVYVGSDHAVSTREEADSSCLLPVGVDSAGHLWVLPDIFWQQCDTGTLVSEMLKLAKAHTICNWWAENEHIHKSIGPFLRARMSKERLFFPITPLTSSKDLVTRSSSIRGMIQAQQVHFPSWCTWWHLAKHQMLSFPKGKHDDFVAALSEIGQGLLSITQPAPPPQPDDENIPRFLPTLAWLKESHERKHRLPIVYQGR